MPAVTTEVLQQLRGRYGEGHGSARRQRHTHATHALERAASSALGRPPWGHASVATTGKDLHARPTDSSVRYLAV